jgi:hypothetical protein
VSRICKVFSTESGSHPALYNKPNVQQIQQQQQLLQVLPEFGRERSGDAVTLRIEVAADFHRVARLTLVDVVVGGRLDEERVLALSDSSYSFLDGRYERRPSGGRHEGPHPLVNRYRRGLHPFRHVTHGFKYTASTVVR